MTPPSLVRLSVPAVLALGLAAGCTDGTERGPGGATRAQAQAPAAASSRDDRRPREVDERGTTASEPAPAKEDPPEAAPEDDLGLDPHGEFLGERDYSERRSLATQPVTDIELGTGGRSVGFKITLADGTVGYYKPEQTFSAAHWYAELASYYIDRELGIGRVPPSVGRRMEWEPLGKVARNHPRLDEVVVQEDGTVRGAFIGWVTGGLIPISPGAGWEKWIRQNGGIAISPYQAPYKWRRQLRRWRCGQGDESACAKVGKDTGPAKPSGKRGNAGEPDTPERPAELSDMILFDYLTNNIDRWGTKFTNVRTRGRGGPLIFLDNGAGFFHAHRNGLMDSRLERLERFRRSTVDSIRELDIDRVVERMATDPLAPILSEHLIEGLRVRRRVLIEHVDGVVRRYGEDAAFPW